MYINKHNAQYPLRNIKETAFPFLTVSYLHFRIRNEVALFRTGQLLFFIYFQFKRNFQYSMTRKITRLFAVTVKSDSTLPFSKGNPYRFFSKFVLSRGLLCGSCHLIM